MRDREQRRKCTHTDTTSTPYLHVDDLVPDQGLKEDANEAHEAVLKVFVLDVFTGGDAVGDVQVDELCKR